MDKRMEPIPPLFPKPFQEAVDQLLEEKKERIEELRLRTGQRLSWVVNGREIYLQNRELPSVTSALLEEIVCRASGHAAYAVEEQRRKGYLTLPGGHRLGLCGLVSTVNGSVKSIRDYQALNLRVARERPGCADALVSFLWSNPGSTLILGPPGVGKTTVLRDLVRQVSDRFHQRVSLVDERGELAACRGGEPQLQVGSHTDILTGCSKAYAIELLTRAMGPEWIALDEITAPEDVKALTKASYCGVRFLATAHAASLSDLTRRPVYRSLMAEEVFENTAVIRPDRSLICERIPYGNHQNCRFGSDPGLLGLGGTPCSPGASRNP